MKIGRLLSLTLIGIVCGLFMTWMQTFIGSSQAVENVSNIPQEQSETRDNLFAGWLENNKGFQKPSDKELEQSLTPVQFDVTREDGTERSFKNEYWDNKESGIYVDIVSGEPLFSSTDKFKSGTGWPSFTRAISENAMIKKSDRSLFGVRTELRSSVADNHLGHIFDDGPAPTGKRYCINSASLRFIPKEKLEVEGYGEFVSLFNEKQE